MKLRFASVVMCALVMAVFVCGCSYTDKVSTGKSTTTVNETTEKATEDSAEDSLQPPKNTEDLTDATGSESTPEQESVSEIEEETAPFEEQTQSEVEIDFSEFE